MANIATITNNVISALSGTTSQVLLGNATLTDFKLDSLTDVSVPTPGDGDVLKWNAATSLWEASDSAGITGSGTTNYLPKFTSASTLGNSTIFDDGTNVGIGTNTPKQRFEILGLNGNIRLYGEGGVANNNLSSNVFYNGTIWTRDNTSLGAVSLVLNPSGVFSVHTTSNTTGFPDERFKVTATGNFIINNPSVDNGLRFQVTGDGYFSGNLGLGVSPATKLHVASAAVTGTINRAVIIANTSASGNGSGSEIYLGWNAPSTNAGAGVTIGASYAGAGTNMLFSTPSAIASAPTVRMTLDGSGNLGLGVTPSAWSSASRSSMQIGNIIGGGHLSSGSGFTSLGGNSYFDGTNWKFVANGYGPQLFINASNGSFGFSTSNVGTANGNITYTQSMTLDASGNLGLGVTPSSWSLLNAFDFGNSGSSFLGGSLSVYQNNINLSSNAYYNGGWKYKNVNFATNYEQSSGVHSWLTAPSGSANAAITWTTAMTLDASGRLGIGQPTPTERLVVRAIGNAYVNSAALSIENSNGANKTYITNANGVFYISNSTTTDQFVLYSTGNLVLSGTSDSGERLQVNGTMRVSGASTFGGLATISTSVYPTLAVISSNSIGCGMYLRATGTSGGYFTILSTASGAGQGAGKLVIVDEIASATRLTIDSTGAATFSSTVTGASFIPTSSTIPTNGMYLPSTNSLGFATNGSLDMTINSRGDIGVGITPSTWSLGKSIEINSAGQGITSLQVGDTFIMNGAYYNTSQLRYANSDYPISLYRQLRGKHSWYYAPQGTIGNQVTFDVPMTLETTGNLLIGGTSDTGERIQVTGSAKITGAVNLGNLAGTGTRIVITDASGNLSTQPTSTYLTSLTGEATNSGTTVTLTNTAVIGKVLTGLNVSSATITASDSILTAFGKIQGQIDALQGGTVYNGSWNANTNTPTITSSTGTQGEYYVVTTAGTTTIDGVSSWAVGDWIIFNGTVWEKIPNVDAITSVNGQTGVVSLTTSNINEGTNLYYTDARARAAISLTTSGSSGASTYSSGVLNIPTYTLAGLGGTPSTRTLTINGTSLDLSVDRSFSVGSVTSVSGTGTVSGLTLTGSITNSGSITLGGALTLTSENVTTGLGFTPYNSTNPAGYTTNTGTVTSIVAGTYLTGGTITTSGTIAVDATTTNTASKIVARDASGNFSAGTITTLGVVSNNFYDSTGSYNVNIGSGGIEGRGVVAGYSGTAYSGIGYNVRHGSAVTYIAPLEDTSSYLSFSNGGFVFYGAPSGAVGRTLSYTTLGSFSAAGTFNAVNITVNGNQTLHAANWNSYAPSLTGTGASGNWGINITGNAVNLSTTRNNWVTNGTITAVVGQLGWRNFGNGHTIFDASNQLSPDGTAVNNTNPSVPWTANYPTLMGWNGSDTYGVRVDISKNAENLGGISSNRAMLKRRNAIVPGAGDSLNTSITSAEMGFTYGGSGEPAGPFISFGGLNLDINYSCQLVGGYVGGNDFKIRTRNDDTPAWNPWRTIITDGNYNSYSPTLTGTGASGTWGINITGNAATATTWQSARTFTIGSTGKSVDGSGNVSWTLGEIGAIPGGSSGQIQFNSSGVFTGSSNFLWDSTENGMRISYASSQGSTYKLQVNGAVYASSYYESSDIKQKNVLAVNPRVSLDVDVVKFTRIGDDDVRYGYSAQQIRDVAPELVSSSGSLGVKYIDVHTLKIAALENEIKELKNKLNGLG